MEVQVHRPERRARSACEHGASGIKRVLDLLGADVQVGAAVRWHDHRPAASRGAEAGYGYAPGRTIWGRGLLTGLGWLVCWRSQRMKTMISTNKEAREASDPDHRPPKVPRGRRWSLW